VWRENDAYHNPPPAKQLENFPGKYIAKYAKQFTHNHFKRQIYTHANKDNNKQRKRKRK